MRWNALAAACIVIATGGSARAGEEEWQLTLAPAYAVVDFDARTPSGAGIAGALAYGLADAWSVRLQLAWSAHPADADRMRRLPEGTLTVLGAFAGVRYAFDVLRTVPYLDVGLGMLWAQGAGENGSVNLSYQAAIGFDRLQSPRWSWGFVISYHGFLPNYSQLPVYLFTGPTISIRWE